MPLDSAAMQDECVIQEAVGSLRPSDKPSIWEAVLITPGKGSSGTYSEEMLAEAGPVAFPAGTKLFFKHPGEGEGPGDRDPRDQWGVLNEDAEPRPTVGLIGKIRILPHWREVVESLGDQASLSIYSSGTSDEDGNVTLTYHRTNGIDMVSHPGREGSGLVKKLEAARASHTPDAASAQDHHQKGSSMELEEKVDALTEMVESLTAKFDSFVAEAAQAAVADEEQNEEKAEFADQLKQAMEAAKAIADAKLVESLEKPLIEAVEKGEDIAERLESAKKITAEITGAAAKAEPVSESFYIHPGSSYGTPATESFAL